MQTQLSSVTKSALSQGWRFASEYPGTDIGSRRGIKFSLKVMDFVRDMIADIQE